MELTGLRPMADWAPSGSYALTFSCTQYRLLPVFGVQIR
jgi:hypothetical protein